MVASAWHADVPLDGVIAQLTTTSSPAPGTTFPYGCRWCGFSTKHDNIEICDHLDGVVHADCHERNCTACHNLLCTPERCDDQAECDECGGPTCARHPGTVCYC